MSRIGKKPIAIPQKVSIKISDEKNEEQIWQKVDIEGPLGQLSLSLRPEIAIEVQEQEIVLTPKNQENIKQKALWGTYRAILNNMILGVSQGFQRQLELNGVGYKMDLSGEILTLNIGYSHPVKITVPSLIKLTLTKNTQLSGTSIDNQLIGNFFSDLFYRKPCDVYKQKGFKVPGKTYRKKVVRKATKK